MIKLPESMLCTDNCVYIDRFIWAVIPEAIDKVLSSLTIQVWVKLEDPLPPCTSARWFADLSIDLLRYRC